MWCALKCRRGEEENIMDACRKRIPRETMQDIFVFTYDRLRRYEGEWHMETKLMFPDYVFLETEDIQRLSEELEPYREFVQVLEGSDMLWRVCPQEERFLRRLCGNGHHLSMSRGYIMDGRTYVTRGPLKGLERQIRKIDRHRRIARIEAPEVSGEDASDLRLPVVAGLEIVSKN